MGVAVFEKSAFEASAFEMARDYVAPLDSASVTITGNSATPIATRYMASQGAAYTITGVDARVARILTLIAAKGAYTSTGISAATRLARYMAFQGAAYSLSGRSANLLRGFYVAGDKGSYATAGVAANTLASRKIISNVGYFNYTGWSVSVPFGRSLRMLPGAYALSGQALNYRAARQFPLAKGVYSWAGNPNSLRATRYIFAAHEYTQTFSNAFEPTAFEGVVLWPYRLNGIDAVLRRGLKLGAGFQDFTSTGKALNLRFVRVISGSAGSFNGVGKTTILRTQRYAALARGTYTATGQVEKLLRQYPLRAAYGSYTYASGKVRLLTTIWSYPDIEVMTVGWEPQTITAHFEDRWIAILAEDRAMQTELNNEMTTSPRRRVA